MQIQSPLADIRLSIDSIKKDGSMVRMDATQQPGRIPTQAYLEPAEVLRLGFHQRRIEQGAGLPRMLKNSVKHPTPTPW